MKIHEAFPYIFWFIIFYLVCGLIFYSPVKAQIIQEDGLPRILDTFTPVNLCFSEKGLTKCEVFHAHDLEKDVGKVDFISSVFSVTGHDHIDTFGLAKWSWWLFGFEILPRVQRQYAQCVERVKVFEQLLRITPKIDEGVFRERVFGVMDYVVPFEAVQILDTVKSRPPSLENALAHLDAAIFTVNLTVAERYSCEFYSQSLARRVNRKFRTRF